MTNPSDPHRYRRTEAIVDVASTTPTHPSAERTEHPPHGENTPDPFAPSDEKLPEVDFMTTSESLRGEVKPEEHAELEQQLRQLLLSHLNLERRVAHVQYLQSFDRIRLEAIASEQQKQRKLRDPRYLRLISIYLPFGFACILFLLEELLRHFAK